MRATPASPLLRRDRRGSAVAVIVLLVLAVTGLGLLSLRQGQQSIVVGVVTTDSDRALQVADACAAGAIKVLPTILEVYLQYYRQTGEMPPIFDQQFDANYFGDDPFGETNRAARCVVQILEIADGPAVPGYSEGGGCFKRVTMMATAALDRVSASSDINQGASSTIRQVVIRGDFGPVNCF